MTKRVTIELDDQLLQQLAERASTEGTTVEGLISQVVTDAVHDPRLTEATEAFRAFIAHQGPAFDEAFPEDAPSRSDAGGRAA
jgi:hypothetical protein